MGQARLDELISSRLMDVFKLALRNMTMEGKALALESPDISDFLMQILKWVPVDAPDPNWEKL